MSMPQLYFLLANLFLAASFCARTDVSSLSCVVISMLWLWLSRQKEAAQ